MNKCTDNLTLGEIKELMSIFGNKQIAEPNPWKVGCRMYPSTERNMKQNIKGE